MFITSHVLAGRIIGRKLADRPIEAFAAGAISHLVMDAIPHWSPGSGPGSYDAFIRIARRDGVVGLGAIAVAVLSTPKKSRLAVLAGITGAAIIDMDKPLKHFFGVNPFPRWFQWFHKVIQRESPNRLWFEILVAAALAATMFAALGEDPKPEFR